MSVSQACNKLYNDKVWKEYTYKVGSQNIDISSLTYTELYIIIVNPLDGKCMSLYIPKITIPSNGDYRYCVLGGYWSDTNAYGGYISISRSSVKLLSFAYGSTDYLNTAKLFLYYRN